MRCSYVLVIAAACGGSPSGGNAGVDASTLDVTTGQAGGEIAVLRVNDGTMMTATASFFDGSDNAVIIGSVDECRVTTAPNPAVTISAGTITITGPATPVTLAPTGEKPSVVYAPAIFPVPADETSLAMSATGADFPAFTADGLVPARIAGFTPPASLSRGSGYTAAWDTAGAGWRFRIEIVANPTSPSELYVMTCDVPDSGTYEIPAAAFALFPPATDAQVSVMRYTQVTVENGAASFVVGAIEGTTSAIPLES